MTVNEPTLTRTETSKTVPMLSVQSLKKVYQVEGGEIASGTGGADVGVRAVGLDVPVGGAVAEAPRRP